MVVTPFVLLTPHKHRWAAGKFYTCEFVHEVLCSCILGNWRSFMQFWDRAISPRCADSVYRRGNKRFLLQCVSRVVIDALGGFPAFVFAAHPVYVFRMLSCVL